MASIRIVLLHSREQGRTDPGMDQFIFGLPEYACPGKNPRPRPLSFGDFELLVSADSLRTLDEVDADNIGLSDIWLTQAFQGGRISETLKLRLGCVGLIGAAQPYIWRDITKVNVIDYGMPCHLPVYERLLRRQSITRTKLRNRYADQLAELDDQARARLEARWDRTMPLFPGNVQNPDLAIEVSQSRFRKVWTEWFEGLGLSGITTHQTRATLATSLLNNGAPAALVRQLLGHFSTEALEHYARYSDASMIRHLQQVWAAGPGTDKPGTILLRPVDVSTTDGSAAAARIDLSVVPVEHGLCRYGPVVGGKSCPYNKNCTNGPQGPCEHFVLTGADLAYWERKRDAAFHFAEGAPNDEARDYILSQWHSWERVLSGLRQALDELGLLEQAEKLDLRSPVHDYFDPAFSTGWTLTHLDSTNDTPSANNR
jgi:integrase